VLDLFVSNKPCNAKAKVKSEGSCGENRESEHGCWELVEEEEPTLLPYQPTTFNQSKSLETPFWSHLT